MSKKKVEKVKGGATKRQLSRWQQQKRRQRIILVAGISVIAVVVGLVLGGLYYQWYIPEIKPLSEIVLEVNGTEFKMDYYIEALKFQSGGQPPQIVQYLLDPVLDNIKQNELVRQQALALGISIGDAEVKETLNSYGLTDTRAARDAVRAQLLITKLKEEYFEPQVPPSTEQRHIMVILLESQTRADEVRARIEGGEDFAQIAGELSLDSLTKEKNGDLGWRPRGILNSLLNTSVLDASVFDYQVGALSPPIYDEDKAKSLGYWLIEILERIAEPKGAHVQAMLLASEEEALTVKERLTNGEDFNELAKEFSQRWTDENKADMGWLTPGTMSQAVDDFIFDPETEVSVVSEPIRDATTTTKGGYWLFKVVDSGTREVSDEDRELLVAQALDDWWLSLLDDPENNIVSYLDDRLRAFAAGKVAEG